MLLENDLKKYLETQLLVLHQRGDEATDTLEQAIIEGAILQLELAWSDLLGEDAPTKKILLSKIKPNRNISTAN